MNALSVFSFQESHPVRVQVIAGEPWFCLKDVCDVLNIANSRRVASEVLDQNGVRKTYIIDSMGREQEAAFVNEPNLYRVIFRSNKPEARQFQNWVFNEVLPAIRKTGGYAYVEPAPKCAAEPLDWRVEHELRAIVNDIAQCFWYKQKWMNGIRHALRNACRTPAPHPLTVDDLPAIVAELRRILAAVETAQGNMRAYERDFLRDVVRRGRRDFSGGDLLPVDLDMDQEKVLPAHFELAIEKLEALSAKISLPSCRR
ncbi:BRO-N domain-containing protein [Enterobacter hormaechei]|uniref:BRO-N domain-containing protein n=1 Tax=Enterobacter TaxID=547 RepID=UPI0018EE01B2|nr:MULTISPECIES: Bro-N domain-containing protein [Enterobacter]MDU3894956.1 Bro-N domain-containing protein [Enterobacter sp.]HDT3543632.1 Bro-N domain-containing protein [Enterobacter hormaechei subsp. steigerwaltii]ELC7456474.1 Bro-N domain-containing protein [Enterobacter hormaechei]EME5919035.1 Bro-N domain-containing protein [Enterobacter hormaechei]MBJ6391614.1 Bro-N domain-containing protein [Enterobacter hormaechei]